MTEPEKKCFIAMPITTHEHEEERYGDADHWVHVRESLFVKAIKAAGYEPIRPVAVGSHLIHENIIQNLEQADMVLCDLSSHNPNVFFELGVRTALDKPVALVKDEHLNIPFDTSGINTHEYKAALNGWEMDDEVAALTEHLKHAATSCQGRNPLWKKFGLTLRAQQPQTDETPLEARLDLLITRLPVLEQELANARNENAELKSALVHSERRNEHRHMVASDASITRDRARNRAMHDASLLFSDLATIDIDDLLVQVRPQSKDLNVVQVTVRNKPPMEFMQQVKKMARQAGFEDVRWVLHRPHDEDDLSAKQ